MAKAKDAFKTEIAKLVEAALRAFAEKNALPLDSVPDIQTQLTVPPSFDLGQSALPCFSFAKLLRQAPPKIAEALAAQINSDASRSLVHSVKAVNGYLNFFCDFQKLSAVTLPDMRNGRYFNPDFLQSGEKEKIVIEYSQPNTHKALHVGHLRCLVLGDAAANLLQYIGHKVVRATFPGDKGANTAKTLWYLKYRHNGPLPTSNQAEWLGEIYAKADTALEAERGTPQEETNREQLRKIMTEVDDTSSEDYKLWKVTRDWCFDEMQRVYEWLRVKFDIWFSESECDKPSKQLVQDLYKQGKFILSDGAIGIDLNPYKLGFAMFLKSDGNSLYITKDLELLRQKFADPEVTRSIYVVDARQKYHFQQLFKTGELLGYPQAAKSIHLPYETVNTEDGKAFSSRSMRGLKLRELRQAMEEKVTTDYLERYRGQWSDDDIKKTAEIVTIGALKYGMLRVDNNTQITFSLNEWLRLDGDTGPYLQYVHARCKNILEKQGTPKEKFAYVLQEPTEHELVYMLGRFNEYALLAAEQLRPSVISGYLFDLAKMFNRFYESCPIRSVEGDLRETRLAVVDATANTIAAGLALLGIPAPNRM